MINNMKGKEILFFTFYLRGYISCFTFHVQSVSHYAFKHCPPKHLWPDNRNLISEEFINLKSLASNIIGNSKKLAVIL